MRKSAPRAAVALFGVALVHLSATSALAFGIDVHQRIPKHAFGKDRRFGRPLPPLSLGEMDAFWAWVRAKALEALPPHGRIELEKRWPAGNRAALKKLLSMNAVVAIWGIDRTDDAPTWLDELGRASGHPDMDFRDRDRLARDLHGEPLRDSLGALVPDDPATLNMGKVTGLSSQASAHYGLLPPPHSSDPDVLKARPERFALATTPGVSEVLTFAPERAELHAELARLAALWKGPGHERLVALFTGAGWHYLQDMGSQLHNVQVGVYDFFVRAKLLYWWRAATTLGGYAGELRPFTSIGLDLITNHHVFVESWGARRILEADERREGPFVPLLAAMAEDEPGFPKPSSASFAEELVRAAIERGAVEGAALYRAAIEVTRGPLRAYGFELRDEVDEPDPFVKDGADTSVLVDFARRGLQRVSTAMRRWWDAHERAVASATPQTASTLAAAMLKERLFQRSAVRARRRAYLASVRPEAPKVLREPVWFAIDAGVIVFVAASTYGLYRLVRRIRRRAAEKRAREAGPPTDASTTA